MKKVIFIFIATVIFCLQSARGQDKPEWIDADMRKVQFPTQAFFIGYAEGYLNAGESIDAVGEKIKTTAQSNLLESLRVVITSNTRSEIKSISNNNEYNELEIFNNSSEKNATAEIAGMNVESYYDKKTNYIYAFAYVNKYELIGFYKANLSLLIQQLQSAVTIAEQLEQQGEKAKARKQGEQAMPLLNKISSAQDLLIAIDGTANTTNLKVTETENLRNTLTQMQARLAQAVQIFISGNENLFGKNENIIANKVKAALAHKGCSFVDNTQQADFTLTINANVRLSSQSEGLVFCYADVEVQLYDTHKQKNVFGDEFSEKSGSSSQEKAGRKAMENASKKIADKLQKWIN
jgi:hypothetical protein